MGWMAWMRVAMAGVALTAGADNVLGEAVHPVVVELFTSEGCSSCPPADALLRAIDAKRLDSGQMVVGISEHVTYWNRLGWADPFSAEMYTQRQEGYRSRFGLESAYTPQVVVNGEREVLGSDRGAVLKAVRETDNRGAVGASPLRIHIGSAATEGNRVRLTYSTSGGAERGVELYAVVAEDEVISQVERGENSGRRLTHVSVARTLTRLGGGTAEGERTVEIEAGAPGRARGKEHVVLFAQRAGLGAIVAVDVAPVSAGDQAANVRR
jgi:hypothetical protein